MRQIELYHREALQAENDDRAARICDIAAALGKDGKRVVDSLRRR